MNFKAAGEKTRLHQERLGSELNRLNWGSNSYMLGRDSAVIPDYALCFIHELVASVHPKNNLDPWVCPSSPAVIFNYPQATLLCGNSGEKELVEFICEDREVDLLFGEAIDLLGSVTGPFDLISSFPPFGFKLQPSVLKAQTPDIANLRELGLILIAKSSELLSEHGLGLFLVADSFFLQGRVEQYLKSIGCYVNAIFALPRGALSNTAMASNLIVVARKPSEGYFFAELTDSEESLTAILEMYLKPESQTAHTFIARGAYRGLMAWKFTREIETLETQYKSFSSHRLGDICEMVGGKSGSTFVEAQNALYVPSIGKTPAVVSLKDTTLKHQNYIQIKLNPTIVLAGYMQSFFSSAMGLLMLQSNTHGAVIPRLTIGALKEMTVPVPSLADQANIVLAVGKLVQLKEVIENFSGHLALNPTSSNAITSQIDDMISVVGGLTEAPKIRAMVREGEGELLEFKETLSWDLYKKDKNPDLETATLKTIVAFLNSKGGVLLIGVADNGDIPGLNFEIGKFHRSQDKLQLSFKNLLKTRIGEQFYPYFDVRFNDVDGKCVISVDCRPSKEPCFLIGKQNTEDFYVRAPAATDKLIGSKLAAYLKSHFTDDITIDGGMY